MGMDWSLKPMDGWYFNIGKREFFVKSNQIRKTSKFLAKVLTKAGYPETEKGMCYLRENMIRARYEICCSKNGFRYVNISGVNFSGFGDENTTVIVLDD